MFVRLPSILIHRAGRFYVAFYVAAQKDSKAGEIGLLFHCSQATMVKASTRGMHLIALEALLTAFLYCPLFSGRR